MEQYYYRVISLGGDCGAAGSLRKIGYKEVSYCFDWTVTELNFIIDCFNSKFKIFENLFEKCSMTGNSKLKYNNSIYFYHDDNVVSKELKQKYIKRSERLHKLCEICKKQILFIRKGKNDTIENVQKLKKAIMNNYPNLKFKILLLNNIKENHYLDQHIIHKYYDNDCFLYCEKDIHYHINSKKSYDCVYNELKKIKSEKFKQPPYRDY